MKYWQPDPPQIENLPPNAKTVEFTAAGRTQPVSAVNGSATLDTRYLGTQTNVPFSYVVKDATGKVLNKVQGRLNATGGPALEHKNAVKRTETITQYERTSNTVKSSSSQVFYSQSGTDNRLAVRAIALAINGSAANDSTIIARENHYNAFGEVVAELDGNNNITELRYDKRGKLIAKINPEETLYNENLQAINGKAVERYGYNAFGEQVLQHNRVEAANDASAHTRSQIAAYNTEHEQISTRRMHNDRVMQERDAEGYNRSFHYDAFGNLRAEVREVYKRGEHHEHTNGLFAKLLYTYNANNQQTRAYRLQESHAAILNGTALRTSNVFSASQYDEQGNRIRQWNGLYTAGQGDDNRHTYRFDGLGRVIAHKSAAGNETHYAYRFDNNVTRRVAATVARLDDTGYSQSVMGGYIVSRWNTKMAPRVNNNAITLDVLNQRNSLNNHVLTEVKDYFGKLVQKNDLGNHQFHYFYNTAGWLSRQTGTTAQGGTSADDQEWKKRRDQDIRYLYHHNGYLYKKLDFGIAQKLDNDAAAANGDRQPATTEYRYDKNGNRTQEVYYKGGDLYDNNNRTVYQHSTARYDNRNRIDAIDGRDEYGNHYQIRYKYDAFNNRRSVESVYNGRYVDRTDGRIEGTPQNFYYTYDRKNRFTITLGQLKDGKVAVGDTGTRIQWNGIDQRYIATRSDGNPVRDRYTYDTNGALVKVEIDANAKKEFVIRSERVTNNAGQITQSLHYDLKGKADGQKTSTLINTINSDGVLTNTKNTDHTSGGDTVTQDYEFLDDGSTIKSLVVNTVGKTQVTYTYAYENWDSYKQSLIQINGQDPRLHHSQNRNWGPGQTLLAYDSNGHIRRAYDQVAKRTIAYANDADGRVLVREDSKKNSSSRVLRHFYYHNGHQVGDVGNDEVPSRHDYAESLANVNANSHQTSGSHTTPVESADFDQNYQPINPNYPGHTFSLYEVQGGETLRQIASTLWGDSALWYLLADANGLKSTDALKKGQRLTVPNVVTNVHNNSETFRPYDAGLALGDTNPTLPDVPPPPPPKKKKGCGGFATVLVVIVAVVATIYTAGAAASLLAGAGGVTTAGGAAVSTFGAGLSALAGGVGTNIGFGVAVATAAAGGVVGSLASQAVGVALGVQEGISLKSAFKSGATSAFGAVAGAGIAKYATDATLIGQAIGAGKETLQWYHVAARAALSTTAGSALGSAAGVSSFSWRRVAVATVSAGATAKAGELVGETDFGKFVGLDEASQTSDSFFKQLPGQLTEELIGEAVQTAIYGDKFDFAGVAGNAIGNSVGKSLDYSRRVALAEQKGTTEQAVEDTNERVYQEAKTFPVPKGRLEPVESIITESQSLPASETSTYRGFDFGLTVKSPFDDYLDRSLMRGMAKGRLIAGLSKQSRRAIEHSVGQELADLSLEKLQDISRTKLLTPGEMTGSKYHPSSYQIDKGASYQFGKVLNTFSDGVSRSLYTLQSAAGFGNVEGDFGRSWTAIGEGTWNLGKLGVSASLSLSPIGRNMFPELSAFAPQVGNSMATNFLDGHEQAYDEGGISGVIGRGAAQVLVLGGEGVVGTKGAGYVVKASQSAVVRNLAQGRFGGYELSLDRGSVISLPRLPVKVERVVPDKTSSKNDWISKLSPEKREEVLSRFNAGNDFEKEVLSARNQSANYDRLYTSRTDLAQEYAVPDSLSQRITEVKDVKDLSVTDQFRIYRESNLPIDLINSPKNQTMSGPLVDLIQDSGGTIDIFNPSSKMFHGFDFETGTYNLKGRK